MKTSLAFQLCSYAAHEDADQEYSPKNSPSRQKRHLVLFIRRAQLRYPPPTPTKFAVFHRQIVKNRLIELRPFRSNFSPTTVQHSEKNGSRCETVQLCSTAQNTDTGCETVKLWSQLKQAPKASISTRSDWPHRRGPHGQVHVRGVAHRRWLTSLPANRLLQTEHSPPSVNETAPSCVV